MVRIAARYFTVQFVIKYLTDCIFFLCACLSSGYHADVMCLQEVDPDLFESYWQPMLEAAGFSGTFAIKKEPYDGIATFWSDKFRLGV